MILAILVNVPFLSYPQDDRLWLLPTFYTILTPYPLHLFSFLALRLLVLDTQFLEVHIGSVVNGTVCAVFGTLLAEESCQVSGGKVSGMWESLSDLSNKADVGC